MHLKIWQYNNFVFQLILNIIDTKPVFMIKEYDSNTNEIISNENFTDIEDAIQFVHNCIMGHEYDEHPERFE